MVIGCIEIDDVRGGGHRVFRTVVVVYFRNLRVVPSPPARFERGGGTYRVWCSVAIGGTRNQDWGIRVDTKNVTGPVFSRDTLDVYRACRLDHKRPREKRSSTPPDDHFENDYVTIVSWT